MVILVFFIWLFLAFIIPLGVIILSYLKYIERVDKSTIIFRFFKALVAYAPVTIISGMFVGGMGNALAHHHIPSIKETLFIFAIVLVYGVIGYLLWSYVNGRFIKPWLIFSRGKEKPSSIFDKNDENNLRR